MPERYRVLAAAINLRSVPSTTGNTPIATLARGQEFWRLALSPDRQWQRIGVELESAGRSLEGWISAAPVYSQPVPEAAPAPVPGVTPAGGLGPKRFNTAARQAYIDSIMKEANGAPAHRFNFFRPSRPGWGDTVSAPWLHAYRTEDGKYHQVGVDFKQSKLGVFKIVVPTQEITKTQYYQNFFPAGYVIPADPEKKEEKRKGMEQTFCNFNVSFCYQQAYGGPNLQDSNGAEKGGDERDANELVDFLAGAWKEVPAGTAARIANAGGFVVAGRKEGGHGHVAFLIEGSDATGADRKQIRVFNVGAGLPRYTAVAGAWSATDAQTVRFFVDSETHAEWTAAGGN